MTDARQVDGLKANIEYWFNLDEESFSNYLLHENSVLSAESTSESVSFDLFRENLEKAKIACRKLLYAFDTNVALIPNIEKFIRTVNIHTSNLRKYLTNESYIVSSTFEVFIGGFQKLLNDCLNSLIKLRGNLMSCLTIYFIYLSFI